jgi:hypothetical protein
VVIAIFETLAKTETGAAEEQPARDRLIHVLTVRGCPDLDSSKPDRGFSMLDQQSGPPYGRNVVLIGFFRHKSPLTVRGGTQPGSENL